MASEASVLRDALTGSLRDGFSVDLDAFNGDRNDSLAAGAFSLPPRQFLGFSQRRDHKKAVTSVRDHGVGWYC